MCLCSCVCAACGSSPAWAAPPGAIQNEPAPGPIVPPALRAQVAVVYPDAARETDAHGDVSVLVDVDESGTVTDARIEAGPEVFHDTALDAARQLVFDPATRDGAPIATTTRVRFHFAPPHEHDAASAGEIVVNAADPDLDDTRARTTLDEAAVERASGDDLAETVSQVAGVRLAGGTTDASKPIIRGQQERRLLVLYDGVRHESQKWGPDHATEIDPFSAGSISVIRGAAGARYGPDAIGGVILVEPPPLRRDPGVGGKAVTAFATNGLRPYAALRLDAVPEKAPRLSFRVEGNAAMGATRQAPDYLLGNTASNTWNVGATAGYRWDEGQVRASWHHHEFKAGIFYGVRNATPGEFQDQFEAGVPVTAGLWEQTYEVDRAYQDVTHDIWLLDTDVHGDWGTLEATYAFQLNHRLEFDQVRSNIVGPQYDFTLRTHSLDTLYRHPDTLLSFGQLGGGVGVQGTFQENVYRGWALLPNYRGFGGGVFGYERLSLDRVDLEVGARYDALARTAYMAIDDYERHIRRGTLDGTQCDATPDLAECPAAWDAASVSLGTLVHVVPDTFDLKLDLSRASRFPNVDELYLAGNAPSFPVYALGYPDLGPETAWNASLTGGLRTDAIEAELSGYGQHIGDYIYFAPDLNDDGEPRFDVTIRGAWPRYTYQPIDALVYGADGSMSVAPTAVVGLDARGGIVRAVDAASGAHLVFTPADHLHLALVGRPPPAGPLHDTELRVTTDLVAKQTRVDPSADFAPAPDGYVLFGLAAETEWGDKRPVRIGAEARNLLNTAYRDYTSLLRYYADQPGRDVRVRVGVDF